MRHYITRVSAAKCNKTPKYIFVQESKNLIIIRHFVFEILWFSMYVQSTSEEKRLQERNKYCLGL